MLTCEYKGNLGNHLFQMWSLIGLAIKHNHPVNVPDHDIFNYTVGERYAQSPTAKDRPPVVLPEKEYSHHEWPLVDRDNNYVLQGYRQAEKYWKDIETDLRGMFRFKERFISHCHNKMSCTPFDEKKPVICISIRRGDFVGNATYFQLPITYYIGALLTHFPDFRENYNLLFLSDDIEYCRVHFECLPNAYFATDFTPIEQLCLGTLCDHHIISNSTFSWWCAYLANAGKVIRPLYNFGDEYRAKNPEHDYWPDKDNWIVFDHIDYKIPLPDVTFMIPVYYDHPDRKENLDLSVCMLQKDFRLEKDQIIVMENDSHRFNYHNQWCKYMRSNIRYFHRTKMLNDMTAEAQTSVVVNWDADVFIPPLQVLLAVTTIQENKADFVYPYDGRFARVVRKDIDSKWYKNLCKHLDVGIFRNMVHFGKKGKQMADNSVGGAIVFNREKFIESGMENEYMISYAPEDAERWDRWHVLNYRVQRVTGKLFHMDHFCGATSTVKHPYYENNMNELVKIRAMTAHQLKEYISTWPWLKKFLPEQKHVVH